MVEQINSQMSHPNKKNSLVSNHSRGGPTISVRTQNTARVARPELARAIVDTIEMCNNKKLNANNAFEAADLASITSIKEFVQNQKEETKWLRAGDAIGANAKVYGFRVDNVHNETYRILNGMNRNALTGDEEIDIIGAPKDSDSEDGGANEDGAGEQKKKKARIIKFSENDGLKTLDDPSKIDVKAFDKSHLVDPLFKQTTQLFDEMSICSLLTSCLNTTPQLLL